MQRASESVRERLQDHSRRNSEHRVTAETGGQRKSPEDGLAEHGGDRTKSHHARATELTHRWQVNSTIHDPNIADRRNTATDALDKHRDEKTDLAKN